MTPRKTKSGNWRVRVYVGQEDGKQHYKSITAPTKAECLHKAAVFSDQVKAGRQPKDITLREAVDQYIALSQTLSPTTLAAYKKVREHAFPSIMDKPVSTLTDITLQKAINAELQRRNKTTGKIILPKTVKNEYGVISGALRVVCKRTYTVRLPKVQNAPRDLPKPEAVMAVVIGSPVELPCMLSMWTSLTMSEIRGIMCSSISGNVISVDRVCVDVGADRVVKDTAKTATRKRRVIVPPYVMSLIQQTDAYREWAEKGIDGFIVTKTSNSIYLCFRKLVQKAGLDITFHDLRHIYASSMLTILNAPSKVVQDAGGWSTPYVMDKVYSNMFDESRTEWANKRDQFLQGILENMTIGHDTELQTR